jgi:hypothetical protein
VRFAHRPPVRNGGTTGRLDPVEVDDPPVAVLAEETRAVDDDPARERLTSADPLADGGGLLGGIRVRF